MSENNMYLENRKLRHFNIQSRSLANDGNNYALDRYICRQICVTKQILCILRATLSQDLSHSCSSEENLLQQKKKKIEYKLRGRSGDTTLYQNLLCLLSNTNQQQCQLNTQQAIITISIYLFWLVTILLLCVHQGYRFYVLSSDQPNTCVEFLLTITFL